MGIKRDMKGYGVHCILERDHDLKKTVRISNRIPKGSGIVCILRCNDKNNSNHGHQNARLNR
jgi:hypothetical protein